MISTSNMDPFKFEDKRLIPNSQHKCFDFRGGFFCILNIFPFVIDFLSDFLFVKSDQTWLVWFPRHRYQDYYESYSSDFKTVSTLKCPRDLGFWFTAPTRAYIFCSLGQAHFKTAIWEAFWQNHVGILLYSLLIWVCSERMMKQNERGI